MNLIFTMSQYFTVIKGQHGVLSDCEAKVIITKEFFYLTL